jgi:hypothetical protein
MTRSSAVTLQGLAVDLRRLPLTAAALAAGQIDRVRAVVIADETSDAFSCQAASLRFSAEGVGKAVASL